MKLQMGERYQWEAQYWWAFSCLVLAGRRNAADFHAELLRRNSESYPAPQEVENTMDEAVTHLAEVLNAALVERQSDPFVGNGWERHLFLLSTRPETAERGDVQDTDIAKGRPVSGSQVQAEEKGRIRSSRS